MKTRTTIFTMTLTISMALLITGNPLEAEETHPSPDQPSSSTETTSESSITRRIYPKIQYPPGFYEGALLLSFSYGKSIAPNGSLIRHEKEFDQSMKFQIDQKALQNGLTRVPEMHYQGSYSPENIYQIDMEYGAWEHFGIGFSMFHYAINMKQQDYYYGSDKLGHVYYEPYPSSKTLFAGNAVTFLGTYHPFSRKQMDPYLCFRAGGVGYSGTAHEGLYYNPNIASPRINNGLGKLVGAGLGMNLFMAPEVGLKFEADYNRSYLSSDQFSSRTLNSYSIQVGFFMNYTAIASHVK